MCSTQLGVGFVNRHMGLPQNTFVSNDAITWLMKNIQTFNSRSEAVEYLQVINIIFHILFMYIDFN